MTSKDLLRSDSLESSQAKEDKSDLLIRERRRECMPRVGIVGSNGQQPSFALGSGFVEGWLDCVRQTLNLVHNMSSISFALTEGTYRSFNSSRPVSSVPAVLQGSGHGNQRVRAATQFSVPADSRA